MLPPHISKKILLTTLLLSCSYTIFANEPALTPNTIILTQADIQASLQLQSNLETQIKTAVTQISTDPTQEMLIKNAVKYVLQEHKKAQEQKEKQNIIALIMEELKTNGSSTLSEQQVKNTLDNIAKNTSMDINQQILEYRQALITMKLAQPERSPKNKEATDNKEDNKIKGWIYIGQIIDNNWHKKFLNIDTGLPEKGKNYLLNIASNLRDSLPSKKQGMSNVITSLTSGEQIKVLNIQASDNKGHYWALVERSK